MEEEQCTEFHVGSCRQYEALRVRKPRRRCKSWNYNSKIPIDVELPDAENFVSGESVICLSRDGDQLIGNLISEANGNVFKFSGFKTKFDPTLDEYVQDGLNSQGASPAEPELDSEELSLPKFSDTLTLSESGGADSLVGSSPRILELARSINRSTPSMSSDGSNDTIEIFGELNLDDIEDDLIDEVTVDDKIGEKISTYFDISVSDMDTGLQHEVLNVKCLQIQRNKHKKSKEDICKLSHFTNKFKFSSSGRLHGDKAEMILHKQFGPRYTGKNYIVFKGEMAFTFKYPICYPKSDVNETKWCL